MKLLVVRGGRGLHRCLGLIDLVLQRFELRGRYLARALPQLGLKRLDLVGLLLHLLRLHLHALLQKLETVAAGGCFVMVVLLGCISRRVLRKRGPCQCQAGSRAKQQHVQISFRRTNSHVSPSQSCCCERSVSLAHDTFPSHAAL